MKSSHAVLTLFTRRTNQACPRWHKRHRRSLAEPSAIDVIRLSVRLLYEGTHIPYPPHATTCPHSCFVQGVAYPVRNVPNVLHWDVARCRQGGCICQICRSTE